MTASGFQLSLGVWLSNCAFHCLFYGLEMTVYSFGVLRHCEAGLLCFTCKHGLMAEVIFKGYYISGYNSFLVVPS